VKAAQNPPVVCTKYLHDAITGRSAHEHIYPILEEIFGEDGYFEHARPPCKYFTGEIKDVQCHSKRTGNSWIRHDKVKADCDPCECKHPPNDYPACSPELNPAELAQNHLKYHVLPELLQEEGIEWKGSVREKMDICVEPLPNSTRTCLGLRKRLIPFAENASGLLTMKEQFGKSKRFGFCKFLFCVFARKKKEKKIHEIHFFVCATS